MYWNQTYICSSTASQGFAWSVLKLRFTKSSACFWSSRLRVVRLFFPRYTTLYFKLLHQSSNCTARNNITSHCSCCQTLRMPYRPELSFQIRLICSAWWKSCRSRFARCSLAKRCFSSQESWSPTTRYGPIRTKPNYRNTELWRISSFLNYVVMMIMKIKSKNTDFCVNPE